MHSTKHGLASCDETAARAVHLMVELVKRGNECNGFRLWPFRRSVQHERSRTVLLVLYRALPLGATLFVIVCQNQSDL